MVKRRILIAVLSGVVTCVLLKIMVYDGFETTVPHFTIPDGFKGKKLPFDQVYEPREVGFPADLSPIAENESIKKILLWTSWHGLRRTVNYYFLQSGGKSFSEHRCPNQKCVVTYDRSELSNADAVVFHLIDTKSTDLPRYRPPGQVWILYNMEAPWQLKLRVYPELAKLENTFNWSMSYRQDSDVVARYGYIEKIRNYSAPKLTKKAKSVAWFVSDCKTDSRREDYVKELQKHIDVDVYGSCGTKKCFPSQSAYCYEGLLDGYKFYLSFENAICKDYVTEKFLNIYNYNVVPVVFGGANYSSVAPSGTYIDATRYSHPKALADYLRFLSQNETAYYDILRRKATFKAYLDPWKCRLCEKLHSAEMVGAKRVMEDVKKWWLGDRCLRWELSKKQFVDVT